MAHAEARKNSIESLLKKLVSPETYSLYTPGALHRIDDV